LAALFEREFHTLSDLSHPHIIEVYDYGVDASGPFYTMELLEGQDLRERTPLSWREACVLLYDVCSSLALIHSRRLVHRDISPRNIRCSSAGSAKLIDFGAMVPMGHGHSIVGTAPFVAPEVVHLSALDGRTDLYSFGATLYYALTGRLAFPARDFPQLFEVWKNKPLPPGSLVDGIPEALDDLVLSLLSFEPALRPRTAFEVMQRLAAIAGLESIEPDSVSRAYLSAPVLVGRERVLGELKQQMTVALGGRARSLLILAGAGLGRTRILDACVLEAQTLGFTVLRARADNVVAGALAAGVLSEQLAAAQPGEGRIRPRGSDVRALTDWFLEVAAATPLALAIDDVHKIDEASLGMLAALAGEARRQRLLLLVTADSDAPEIERDAFKVLVNRSERFGLDPLTRDQTEALLKSLFGDVPNVGILSAGMHEVAAGIPRNCMDLAQHLVDESIVLYGGGVWSLPSRLDPRDLPRDTEAAIRARIEGLSELARWFAEAQALSSHSGFTREDYALLRPEIETSAVDQALSELVFNQILVSDGRIHTIAHRGWTSSLVARLGPAEREQHHRALAALHEWKPGLAVIRHQLAGGLFERGLDRLAGLLETVADSNQLREGFQLDASETAAVFEHALRLALELKRKPREINMLRRWLTSLAIAADDRFYWAAAPEWLAQLKHDAGLDFYEAMADVADPAERRSLALEKAFARHEATGIAQRVYRPDEAIRYLVQYVVISIAIGARSQNVELISSLPPLLEPFAATSPAVDAILHNALATREARCLAQPERARQRWLDVYVRLSKLSLAELPALGIIRHAIAAGIGAVEAQMGLATATTWAELLEQDPLQQVHALYLRKAVCLQQGDWEGADALRRKAELLELSARTRQMFTSSLMVELNAHALADDLTGVKQLIDRIEPLAARAPGWVPYLHFAQGRFEQVRGDFAAARRALEKCLALCTPEPDRSYPALPAFAAASAAYVETLVGLGRLGEARAAGDRALALCFEHSIEVTAHDVARALALAEAKLGYHAQAAQRLDMIIQEQRALGVTGLTLGASYEARARVAAWAGDEARMNEYARLTAREYRYGSSSPLGARYERLIHEVQRTSTLMPPELSELEQNGGNTLLSMRSASASEIVTRALQGVESVEERAERALALLCEEWGSSAGYLYLYADQSSGEARLRLVASRGLDAPPPGLLEFLNAELTREVVDQPTMTVDLGPGLPGTACARVFTDAAGKSYDSLRLICVFEGLTRQAGVAVFADNDHVPASATITMTAAALGSHLIKCGDALGLPVK